MIKERAWRITDIKKLEWNKAGVEFFDMRKNQYGYATRKIKYTPKHPQMEGYIIWSKKKKDISALLR